MIARASTPFAVAVVLAAAACGDDGGGGSSRRTLIDHFESDFADVLHIETAGSRTFFDVRAAARGAYPCDTFVSYSYEGGTEFMEGTQGPYGRQTVMQGHEVVAFLGTRDFPDEDARRTLPQPNWFSNPPCVMVEDDTAMMHADLVLLATPDSRVIVARLDEESEDGLTPVELPVADLMSGLKGFAAGDGSAAAKVRDLYLYDWPP